MSHSSSDKKDNITKTAWEVCKYYMISFFVEKLLLNACLMPILCPTQYRFFSAFQNSKDWLLKCHGLKVLIFKCLLLTLK
jgi:hypothetical protein